MKWSARDILDILRMFALASNENVPRNIEQLRTEHPDELSTLFQFFFLKRRYIIVADPELDDDPDRIIAAATTIDPNRIFEVIPNPGDDTAQYATRYHGKIIYLVREAKTTQRLDVYLAEKYPELSRSAWQKHIKAGNVVVNNQTIVSPKTDIAANDTVKVSNITRDSFEGHTLPILFQNDDVIVVNKPAGILTHSKGVLNDEFTVADFFARSSHYAKTTNRPGIIHRLDRDTSGVLIGAQNAIAAQKLQKQFSDRTVKKTYIAVLASVPAKEKGLIDVPIGRNPSAPSTFRADANGKPAQTYYETLAVNDKGQALVRLQPKTGRTHQLRVHVAFIGTPILGDRIYGKSGPRLFLHAYQLEITVPENGVNVRQTFTAPVPAELLELFPGVVV